MLVLNDFTTSLIKAFDEIDPEWRSYRGLVICGTHAPHDVEEMLKTIQEAREKNVPYLGICFGHQLAAIEWARNVKGIKDATSEEFGKGTFIVKKRDTMKIGLHEGESYWSNYDVVLDDWEKPSYFLTTPSHPEYQSSIEAPHPLLVQFLLICKKQLDGNVFGPQH